MWKKASMAAMALAVGFAGGFGAGCAQKKAYERGTVRDGIYSNDFFGITLTIPAGMYVMPQEQTLTHSDDVSGLLLFISAFDAASHVPDIDSGFNYNIAVTSEKLPSSSGIRNNGQYAAEAVRRLESSADSGMAVAGVEDVVLGGREFVKFTLTGGGIRQDIYACYHDGYALILTCTYADETGRSKIADILSTITMAK